MLRASSRPPRLQACTSSATGSKYGQRVSLNQEAGNRREGSRTTALLPLSQGASLLMLMAKSRHRKADNARRYFKPSPEAIAEVTSFLAPIGEHL